MVDVGFDETRLRCLDVDAAEASAVTCDTSMSKIDMTSPLQPLLASVFGFKKLLFQ